LRRSHISESFLAQLNDGETKREWLDRIFPKLESSDRGLSLIQQMARSLAEQAAFPDLQNWEDSAEKIREAKAAVESLKEYLGRKDEQHKNESDVAKARDAAAQQRQKTVRSQADLAQLQERLNSLCNQLGTQKGGYAFQDWFYDLMDYSDVDNRRPYVASGRQIDGSVTIDGTTYLVELKFTASQTDATEIDSLVKKVNGKADNTMGIMISMSGYSSVAIQEASFAKSPIILLDHSHLYMVLGGIDTFGSVVRRIRRHSSQEGKAFLAVSEFGGRL
jgi:uncharacterized protein (DUF1810 family)